MEASIALAKPDNLWEVGSRLPSGKGNEILFGQVREDTSLEASFAFGRRALCVASGGETAFDLLLGGARDVVAVDVNPSQLLLVSLKAAAFRQLAPGDVKGAMTSDARPAYEKLRERLDREVQSYFDAHLQSLSRGLIGTGKIDRQLRTSLGLFRKTVHSESKIRQVLSLEDPKAQSEAFDRTWNSFRWRMGVKVAFSPFVLSRAFGKFFGSLPPREFGNQVAQDIETVLRTVPLRDNPYMWQTFLGEYPVSGLPNWLREYGLVRMAQVISRLGLESGDLADWLLAQSEPMVELVCLSNILECADSITKAKLVKGLLQTVTPGGIVIARSLFNQEIGLDKLSNGGLSRVEEPDWANRSVICRHVEIYRVSR